MVFAAYRVTRLIVIDAIFDEPRAWFLRKLGFRKGKDGDLYNRESMLAEKLVYLFTCTWCVGIWVSGILYVLVFREFDFLNIFAVAGGQGILHALEPDGDD